MFRRTAFSGVILGLALVFTALWPGAALGQDEEVKIKVEIQNGPSATSFQLSAPVDEDLGFHSSAFDWTEPAGNHSTTVSGFVQTGPDGKPLPVLNVFDSGECTRCERASAATAARLYPPRGKRYVSALTAAGGSTDRSRWQLARAR
jgi:hypothetical protein